METQLLTTENKITEIIADGVKFTLTDKRLIVNNKFIGLHELRGATVSTISVTDKKSQDHNVVKAWCILVLTVIFFIGISMGLHPYKFFEYCVYFGVALIGGLVFGSLIALPIYGLLKGYSSVSAKTSDKILLKIEKMDNTYFINNYFELDNSNHFTTFVNEINSLIYR